MVSRFGLKTGGGRFPGLSSKPAVDGFPVWPQNQWSTVSRFSLKTGGERFPGLGLKTGGGRFVGLGLKTDGGRFPGLGLKTGGGGWWCTWHHREGSFEVKLSCEGPDGVRVTEKKLDGNALMYCEGHFRNVKMSKGIR
ncbi:hypothetical protein EJB05_28607, partial [Eragrostis curvula]